MSLTLSYSNTTTQVYRRTRVTAIERVLNKLYRCSIDAHISVSLIGAKHMKKLNKTFRHVSSETDVLSFPTIENIVIKGKKIIIKDPSFVLPPHTTLHLGDIFVCREVAIRQAKECGYSDTVEIDQLIIHGIFHILGCNHERAHEKIIMQKHEESVYKHL